MELGQSLGQVEGGRALLTGQISDFPGRKKRGGESRGEEGKVQLVPRQWASRDPGDPFGPVSLPRSCQVSRLSAHFLALLIGFSAMKATQVLVLS